jgi:predicted transcriptional regulator
LTSVGIVASVAGVFGTYQSGADVVLEESELAVKTNFPVIPDDMYYSDVAVQGDRQVVRLRNPTAGSVDVRVLMQVTQLR